MALFDVIGLKHPTYVSIHYGLVGAIRYLAAGWLLLEAVSP